MLEKLRQMDLDRLLNLEEAVALSAYARTLINEYAELELDIPEWVIRSTDALREEIARRTRAEALSQYKAAQAELDSLKSVGERKADVQARLASLSKKLGLTATKVGK